MLPWGPFGDRDRSPAVALLLLAVALATGSQQVRPVFGAPSKGGWGCRAGLSTRPRGGGPFGTATGVVDRTMQ